MFLNPDPLINNINIFNNSLRILNTILLFFIYLGFLFIGKYKNNKFLYYISGLSLIIGLLIGFLSLIGLFTDFLEYIPLIYILNIIIGFTLIKIKDLNLVKITGISLLTTGIIHSIVIIFNNFYENFTILFNLIWIIGLLIKMLTYILLILLFINAYKKFESN